MYNLYTIGYSSFQIEDFIKVLQEEEVNALADVRSKPFSKTFPDYNMNNLRMALKPYGIAYVPMCDQLGAQPTNPAVYTDGHVDFDKFAQSDPFLEGCERLKNGLTNYTICIMCAEKDPVTCHRAILVAHNMKTMYPKINIYHIQPKVIESHSKMEERLLALTGNQQNSLMGGDPLENAYLSQGRKIAYTPRTSTDYD